MSPKRRPKRRPREPERDESSYVCTYCGEEIVVPIDPSAGQEQRFIEDCPVCCHPHVLHVRLDDDGRATLHAERE